MIRFQKNWRWVWYGGVSKTHHLAGYWTFPGRTSRTATSTGFVGYRSCGTPTGTSNGDIWYTRKTSGYRADLGYQPENDLHLLEFVVGPRGVARARWWTTVASSVYTANQRTAAGTSWTPW